MKAALFIILGITILLGVVGGIENTLSFDLVSVLQLLGMTLVGFATLALGVSYSQE